ncbi:MAG: SUMF1/EgtB/PvdO family nonheme iron enzyme, partial [Planctomycetes bacterium]|nr:SUMF1/EgtB/PvdO family nonheme iron enzyme [Planctomycetota bacterium]
FEQDHNYYPTMMNDGRVIYLRWEYTDIPHVWGRYLFTMNPDGTGQRALYGSGGYWPNSMFYAKPIPDHPTKIVCIFTGHHIGREGELMVLDPALGRKSAEGVIQQIPGYGKKPVPRVQDKYTEFSWPKFTHPWPLSENYFIVSCKPRPEDLWGIYLVDTFDNMILLKEIEGHALFEPMPLRKTKTPPVIADRVDLARQDALMYIENIYAGPGLKGVPNGSVKQIRLYTYHFAYDKTVGISSRVGTNGPWEPKRIIGTVPVEEDGSAFFRVPANTPLSLQPLDGEGKAMQLMRSWTTAQPGEMVSCTGCHENQSTVAPNRSTIASRLQPAEIEPWRGPVRGFGFKHEVQPVLDKYCVGCHNGSEKTIARGMPDLRDEVAQDRFVVYKRGTPEVETIEGASKAELLKKYPGVFDPSFIALRGYVRVGGLESDLRQQNACEFHADTSELIQMLKKGHHGVKLDDEAWDRLVTWIDLNATCHATWRETAGMERISKDHQRRRDLRLLYAGLDDDPETIPQRISEKVEFVKPDHGRRAKPKLVHVANWPFDAGEAVRKQTAAGPVNRSIDLGNGVTMEMVRIPAGQFVMGDLHGNSDERPLAPVKVEKAFWMSKFEVTNEQYARFNSSHDSRYEHAGSMIFSEYDLGPLMNKPSQPVVRTSWTQAMAFCRWLSETSGQEFTLPTEAQWEYACRAGTNSPMSFGNLDTDFSTLANMADQSIRELAHRGRHDVPDLIPRDNRFDDGHLVTAYVGSYKPNPWGLCDMHGNIWEWTRSAYMEYPYDDGDGRNDIDEVGERVVRGGSWNDRPKRCRSAFRLSYPGWQQVYNVGFRVIIEADGPGSMVAQTK